MPLLNNTRQNRVRTKTRKGAKAVPNRFTKRAALRLLGGVSLACAGTVLVASVATGASAPKKTSFVATDLSTAATDTIAVSKSESGRLAQTDPALLGQSGSDPVN